MNINPEGHQVSGSIATFMAPQGPQYGAPISNPGPPLQIWGDGCCHGPGPISMSPGHMANLAHFVLFDPLEHQKICTQGDCNIPYELGAMYYRPWTTGRISQAVDAEGLKWPKKAKKAKFSRMATKMARTQNNHKHPRRPQRAIWAHFQAHEEKNPESGQSEYA
ncbi:hypothetical protein O181_038033 [Austropuccinia psidii MF-1]|uniref:Uncharacterized protein n=1 Tax=Austropuccinia psidii MF-1 TaxID=1389203 RepID=A0A9Q3DAN0_9BASI|nr:hypothetical protein [Austropuccinia psidii MF-1]